MRRKQQEIRDRDALEAILEHAQICRLALSADGQPYIVPVNYGYANGKIYVHGATQGKKIDLLRHNPRLGFEVEIETRLKIKGETPCNWGMQFQSIIGSGTARFLEMDLEKRLALDVITRHYGGEPPDYAQSTLDRLTLIEITIEEMTGKNSEPLPADLGHRPVDGENALG